MVQTVILDYAIRDNLYWSHAQNIWHLHGHER